VQARGDSSSDETEKFGGGTCFTLAVELITLQGFGLSSSRRSSNLQVFNTTQRISLLSLTGELSPNSIQV
jgi:hypothetical protein